jgi:hypothetical protein
VASIPSHSHAGFRLLNTNANRALPPDQPLERRHNAAPQDHCEAAFMVNVIGDTHAITLFLMDLTSHVDLARGATTEPESRTRPG